MRIVEISIFLFVFFSILGALNEINIFSTPKVLNVPSFNATAEVSNIQFTPTRENATDIWATISYYQAMVLSGVGFITQGINILMKIFSVALNFGGYLQQMIPFLPSAFCNTLTGIIDIIYIIGVIQFLTGRGFKGMD